MLLRAVDDAVGVTRQLAQDLHDPRDPALVQHRLSELLRTRLKMIALGYRDQGDAELLSRDPVLRLAVSDAAGLSLLGDTTRASQPTMSRLIDTLAIPSNLVRLNRALLDGAIRCGGKGLGLEAGTRDDRRRFVSDRSSWPSARVLPRVGAVNHTATANAVM